MMHRPSHISRTRALAGVLGACLLSACGQMGPLLQPTETEAETLSLEQQAVRGIEISANPSAAPVDGLRS